jgi:hypothetical protein
MVAVPTVAGSVRPKRRWIGPAPTAKAMETTGAGVSPTPARSGLKCQTSCMNSALPSRKIANPVKNRNRAIVATVNGRLLKSSFSMIGAPGRPAPRRARRGPARLRRGRMPA